MDVANKGRYIRCPLSIFLYQKMAVYMGGSAHFRSTHLLPLIFFFFVIFASPVTSGTCRNTSSIGKHSSWTRLAFKPCSSSSSAPNWEPSGHLLSRWNLCLCNFFFFFNLTPYGIDLRFQFVLWKLGNNASVCTESRAVDATCCSFPKMKNFLCSKWPSIQIILILSR